MDGTVEKPDGALGNGDLLGRGRRIGIGAHRVGDDRDPDGVRIRLGRLRVAPRRFDAALHTAEQVDLVSDVDAGIDAPIFTRRARQDLPVGRAVARDGGADARLRQPVGAGAAQ